MNIVIFISSLRTGGAERVVSRLSSFWADKENITIITLHPKEDDFYPLNLKIKRIHLLSYGNSKNLLKAVQNNLSRILKLKRALTNIKPDIVISFLDSNNITACSALLGSKTPLIISERNKADPKKLGIMKSLLQRFLYRRASCLICVSEGVNQDFKWFPAHKRRVIYNPLNETLDHTVSDNQKRILPAPPFFLAVGSLTHQKGYDHLISAFKILLEKNPEYSLAIAGDGPLKSAISEQIESLGLHGKIVLLGKVKNVQELMKLSFCYVLSSRYEGFPNALIEAMSTGAPCISFNCEHGPGEIMTHNYNGLLVPPEDVIKLSEAMQFMINHPEERICMGKNAKEITEKLSIHKISAQWGEVINSVTKNG